MPDVSSQLQCSLHKVGAPPPVVGQHPKMALSSLFRPIFHLPSSFPQGFCVWPPWTHCPQQQQLWHFLTHTCVLQAAHPWPLLPLQGVLKPATTRQLPSTQQLRCGLLNQVFPEPRIITSSSGAFCPSPCYMAGPCVFMYLSPLQMWSPWSPPLPFIHNFIHRI